MNVPQVWSKNNRTVIAPAHKNGVVWCCHRHGQKQPQVREIDTARLHLNFKLASG